MLHDELYHKKVFFFLDNVDFHPNAFFFAETRPYHVVSGTGSASIMVLSVTPGDTEPGRNASEQWMAKQSVCGPTLCLPEVQLIYVHACLCVVMYIVVCCLEADC